MAETCTRCGEVRSHPDHHITNAVAFHLFVPSAPSPRDEGRAREEALKLAAALPAAWERIADERFPVGEGLYASDANHAGAMVARSWLRECAADLREALAPAACEALASLGTEGR
jgi:hypothetical protein